MSDAPVLRVLSGRLTGTERPLPAGGTVSIGHQFWQDVVIRDPATKGIAVDLAIDGGGAQITVLTGEAALLGSRLEAGQTALLPPFVPFSIGGVALAWGAPNDARWAEAGELARSTPAPPATLPTPLDQAGALIGRAGEGLGSVLTGRRAAMLAGIAVLALGAATALPAMEALGLRADPATRVDRALAEAGLPALIAANDPRDDGVTVTGVVRLDAERAEAQEVARRTHAASRVDVQTSAELARAGADVARIHGLQAVARPIGLTAVELRTTPLSDSQRARLVQAVRADVRQIGKLALRDDLPPKEDAPLRTIADATKKVSTVVSGEPGYVQTVDGARYFAGAVMPSGHRLLGIRGNVVYLEKNGRQTRLTF